MPTNKRYLRSKVHLHLKIKVFEQCVMPVLVYGTETMTFTQKFAEKFGVAPKGMERGMLGVTLRKNNGSEIGHRRGILQEYTKDAGQGEQWSKDPERRLTQYYPVLTTPDHPDDIRRRR